MEARFRAFSSPHPPLKITKGWRNVCVLHRRSQNFVWGWTFLPPKSRRILVVALKTHDKTAWVTSPVVQISQFPQKNWTLALPRGALSAWAGALNTFLCKFGPQNFLSTLGLRVHPVHPLATPVACCFELKTDDTTSDIQLAWVSSAVQKKKNLHRGKM